MSREKIDVSWGRMKRGAVVLRVDVPRVDGRVVEQFLVETASRRLHLMCISHPIDCSSGAAYLLASQETRHRMTARTLMSVLCLRDINPEAGSADIERNPSTHTGDSTPSSPSQTVKPRQNQSQLLTTAPWGPESSHNPPTSRHHHPSRAEPTGPKTPSHSDTETDNGGQIPRQKRPSAAAITNNLPAPLRR